MKPDFTAGQNLAMKVPAHEFDMTVVFYRDVLGFKEVNNANQNNDESYTFEFGGKYLWIDKVNHLSRAEIWLEIETENVALAKDYLAQNQCNICDDIEKLPAGFQGFWVSSPANIIHLVSQE